MSGTLSPWPVVQIGHHGHPVETLQFLLRARGHQLTVDGAFGPLTAAAAKAFQTSKGLTSDGVINPQTWIALVIQVKRGDRGDAVRGVQQEFQFRNGSGDPNQGLQIDGASDHRPMPPCAAFSTRCRWTFPRWSSTASSAPSPGRRWSAGCCRDSVAHGADLHLVIAMDHCEGWMDRPRVTARMRPVSTHGMFQSFARAVGGFFLRPQQGRTGNAEHEPDRLLQKIRLDHLAPELCKPPDEG